MDSGDRPWARLPPRQSQGRTDGLARLCERSIGPEDRRWRVLDILPALKDRDSDPWLRRLHVRVAPLGP